MPSSFLAYRLANAALRDRLTKAIVALRSDDFPFEFWTDSYLAPGKKWEKEIAIRIDEADIFFLLVTTDLTPTSYVMETELRRAIDRARKNPRIRIVPIIADNIIGFFREAGLDEFKYSSLPRGGKGLSSYGDTSEWIRDVVTGVKQLIEHELAGMQLNSLSLDEEVKSYRNSIEAALSEINLCEGSLDRYTSMIRFSLMRSLDALEVGSEAFLEALEPVRVRLSDARRAARGIAATNVERALRDVIIAIDDVKQASISHSGVPVTHAVPMRISLNDPGSSVDGRALDSNLDRVGRASEQIEDLAADAPCDRPRLAAAGRQIGAESRIARTALQGGTIETTFLNAAVDQLSRTVNGVVEQAPPDLDGVLARTMKIAKSQTDYALVYARRLYARAAGNTMPEKPSPEPTENDSPVSADWSGDAHVSIGEDSDPFAQMTDGERTALMGLVSLAQGDAQYTYEIGTMYQRGRKVRKSVSIARAFYKRAARSGYARAWVRLEQLERDLQEPRA